jgi:hypothetical protein
MNILLIYIFDQRADIQMYLNKQISWGQLAYYLLFSALLGHDTSNVARPLSLFSESLMWHFAISHGSSARDHALYSFQTFPTFFVQLVDIRLANAFFLVASLSFAHVFSAQLQTETCGLVTK